MLRKKMMSIFLISTILFSMSANPLVVFADGEDLQEAFECNIEETENDAFGEENGADINSTNISLSGSSDNEIVLMSDDAPFAGGSGTEEDPYQVSTPEQLDNVRNYLNKYFIQICDIDMTIATCSSGGAYYNSGAGWTPIGNSSSKNFKGEYNGDGYAIKGLYCKGTLGGLFGYNSGTLKNIAMIDCNIIGTGTYTGSIVCYNKGIVKGCYNTGKIKTTYTAGASYIGGIVGASRGSSSSKLTVSDCYNLGTISLSTTSSYSEVSATGGIIGLANYTTIERCFNKGIINDTKNNSTGGIAGSCHNATISQCFNDGEVLGIYDIGGIVGYDVFCNIDDCYNKGLVKITGTQTANAISGSSLESIITNCYNSNPLVSYISLGMVTINTSYNVVADSKVQVLTDEEMKIKDNFVGFDFDTVWDISPAINDGYPYLQNVGNFIPTYSAGDINGDGYVDFIDAQLILKYDAGLLILTDEQIGRSDLNGDGYIDFIDAQIILKYDAGLIDTL